MMSIKLILSIIAGGLAIFGLVKPNSTLFGIGVLLLAVANFVP